MLKMLIYIRKEGMIKMKVKEWFIDKNFTQNEKYVIECGETSIEKETEKAYLLKWYSDYGFIIRWVPKSCIYTNEEYEKVVAKKVEKIVNGLSYSEKLVEYAKANNIKGARIGLKTATLIQKIKNAGLEIPVKA